MSEGLGRFRPPDQGGNKHLLVHCKPRNNELVVQPAIGLNRLAGMAVQVVRDGEIWARFRSDD